MTIEFICALVLTFIFLQGFSFLKSVGLGAFYSVMAFCNAGFSFFNDSLTRFADIPALLYAISALTLLGGLGFFVIVDIYDTYKEKRLHFSTHTKVVVCAFATVVFISFIVFLFSDALRGHGIFYLINNAFFQAVSTRTSGFYSVPLHLFNEFTDTILMFLISIGAAPGSTAGGMRVTTLVLVFVFVKSVVKGEDGFVIFKKQIPSDIVKKALTFFIIFLTSIVFFSICFVFIEGYYNPLALVFEVVSAFSTVGLSLGITDDLSTIGKIFIIIVMTAGRIGILTMLIFMLNPAAGKKNIKYPEARILVG